MKKMSLCIVAITLAAAASAQTTPGMGGVVLDAREDTTNVVTITDIIAVQEMVTSQNTTDAHFNKVWGYTSYFNLGYNTSATLTPKEEILSGLDHTQMVEPFKSDWGMSLTLGHNYRLHKKAIANVLQFNIDWTYINLHINHFEAAKGDKLFDSNLTYTHVDPDEGTTSEYNYIPWNMEKYEFNYNMELGPSITIAPFTLINNRALNFLKLNLYYHWGYELSLINIGNDKKLDVNTDKNIHFKEMNGSSKQTWGSGMTGTFGFSVNWRTIGLGWETRSSSIKYQSLQKELFGSFKYKFKDKTNRIYLQIRF